MPRTRGATILVVGDDLIVEGRLYIEPVDKAGEDIDHAVQQLYKPPATVGASVSREDYCNE